MKIVLVNGINTNGEGNVDLLGEELRRRGLEVVDVALPVRHSVSARWGGCPDGLLVAQAAVDGDVLVAHSFGCVRAHYAHRVRDLKAIVCVAPAMSPHARWRDPARVTCYHSSRDLAVRLGARLLCHPFGPAGVAGFSQPGVTNVRRWCGHSGYFRGPLLLELADRVADLAVA